MEGFTFPIPDEWANIAFGERKSVFEESVVAFSQSGLVAEGVIQLNPLDKSCSILKFDIKRCENGSDERIAKSNDCCTSLKKEDPVLGVQVHFEKKRDDVGNVQHFVSSVWGSEEPIIRSHLAKEQAYSNFFLESNIGNNTLNLSRLVHKHGHEYKGFVPKRTDDRYEKPNYEKRPPVKWETFVTEVPGHDGGRNSSRTEQNSRKNGEKLVSEPPKEVKCHTAPSLQNNLKDKIYTSSIEQQDLSEDGAFKSKLNVKDLRTKASEQHTSLGLQKTQKSDVAKSQTQCRKDSKTLLSSWNIEETNHVKTRKSETPHGQKSYTGISSTETEDNWDLNKLMDPFDEKYPDLKTEQSLYENVKLCGENKRTKEMFEDLILFADSNGFEMKDTSPTGNCMFQSINDQLQINGDFRFDVYTLRHLAVEYLRHHPTDSEGAHLESFLDEPWTSYLARMAQPYEWGDHLVLKALCEVLQRNIIVTNVQSEDETSHHEFSPMANDPKRNETLNLGHLGEFHYVSLRPKLWKQTWTSAALNNRKIEKEKEDPQHSNRSKIENHLIRHLTEVDPISEIPVPYLSFAMTQITERSDICYLQIPSKLLPKNDHFIETAGGRSDGTEAFIIHKDRIKHAGEFWVRYSNESPLMMVYVRDTKCTVLCDGKATPLPDKQIRAEIGESHPGYCTLRYFGKKELLLTASDVKVEGGRSYPERTVWAYHCSTWPASAKEWLERNSRWPTAELKEKIEELGCYVAKRSHPSSKNPVYEWQFIFSDAEKLLVKEGLTQSQLYVYSTFKSCLDYHAKHLQYKLGNAHVKSMFFYVCEVINDDIFEESPGVCFIYLAGTLLTNLMNRELPNYFIRGNNMIDHWKDEEIEQTIQILEAIRHFPLHSLVFMMDGRGYNRSGIIDIIQKDSETNRGELDLNRAFCHLFFPMIIRQARKFAKCKRYRKAYEKIRDARLLLVLAPLKNEAPVFVPSLDNIIKQSLRDVDGKPADYVTREMDESIKNFNTARKIKDFTDGNDVGGFGEIYIPSHIAGDPYKEAIVLNSYGVILHNTDRNYEDASTYYAAAIDRLEQASKEDEDSQTENYKRSFLEQYVQDDLTLMIFENIINTKVFEKLLPRMIFLEKVCLRMKNTENVDFVMEAWEKIGNPEQAAKFHASFLENLSKTQ